MDNENESDSDSDRYSDPFELIYTTDGEIEELSNTVLPPIIRSDKTLSTLTGSDFLTRVDTKYTVRFYQRSKNPHIYYVESKYSAYNYLTVFTVSGGEITAVGYNGVVSSRSKALHIIWYYKKLSRS